MTQGPRTAEDALPTRTRGRPKLAEPSPEYRQRMDEIVVTAAEVFRRDGYRTGSLDDVAQAMGLRKSSLYYYVRSKAELLYLIFDRAISSALQRLEELEELSDPAQRLASLIGHQIKLMADEPEMFAVFFDSRPRLDETYERRIRAKERRYLRIYAEAVRAGSAAGVLPEIDPRYGAQALLGMAIWVYRWFDPERDDTSVLVDSYVRLILREPPASA